EVAVVTDVRADLRVARLEDREPEVARTEEELLPELVRVRDVVLAVLAEVRAVGIEDRRAVVVDAWLLALVERNHHRHLVLLRVRLHHLGRGPGDRLRRVVPKLVLARTEVGTVEDLLQSEDL